MASWIIGAVMGLIALFGLLLASRAHDGVFSYFGLALFAFGVLYIYGMVIRATGHPPRQRSGDHSHP